MRISKQSYIPPKDSAEYQNMLAINQLQEKISFEIFRKTEAEKEALRREQSIHPSGRHAPDNREFNESFNRG